MKLGFPFDDLLVATEFCKDCKTLSEWYIEFQYIDVRNKELIFFLYCKECDIRTKSPQKLLGWKLRTSFESWRKNSPEEDREM